MARADSPATLTFPVSNLRFSASAHHEAISSGIQAISNSVNVGSASANTAVTDEPSMAPTELPTAMNANSLLPWLLSKQSAMKPQKTVTTNNAKTLVHT